MNNSMSSSGGEILQSKAAEIAEFLRDILNRSPEEVTALFEQIGIKDDSDESEWLSRAMGQENYIAMSERKRFRVDDMVASLRSVLKSEYSAE